ncbi:senescence-associated protein [Cucumis melo var. makuwa]|uniref:Senescence-associated protein n=1 Tax=Cucumis melo var. makuwa TaxID=1194695 RepID=A0A5D3D275_CUCMM|nr:senescence-associated protein [Cucumis melo var. makuwa]TYK17982.1 senescence-associated protein [Cucumis melo var. makuwa]
MRHPVRTSHDVTRACDACPTHGCRHMACVHGRAALVCMGARMVHAGSLHLVDNRVIGACVTSSLDSDLEAFNRNQAHGSFAPLAFQPNAMTNYVSPQPNSPPDNFFRPDRPAEASLMSRKRGSASLSFHEISLLFPLILPSSFPWLWFHWIVDKDNGNLVNPFMHISTDGRSARAHAQGFVVIVLPSYSSRPGSCPNDRVSVQIGTITQLLVYLASLVLLTKNGLLGALDFVTCSQSNPSLKTKVGRWCNPLRDTPARFHASYEITHLLTHTHVRLLSPCFKTGRMGSPQADAKSAQMSKPAIRHTLPAMIWTTTSPQA